MKKIGMVTIGQSPRVDVREDIKDILSDGIEIHECGALDDLTMEEIKELTPSEGEYILVTRLRDGREVKVSREKILSRMNECIKKLEEKCDIIVVLCTGEFEGLKSSKLLIEPSILLYNTVKSILPSGKLGVVIPSKDQVDEVKDKWKDKNLELVIKALSPYESQSEEKIVRLANELKKENVDLIVLDCIGYSKRISELIKKVTNKPTILSRTLVARVVRELI